MITVMGAGAFGTALAVSMSKKGPVRLWARGADRADTMRDSRENPRLPGVTLPHDITISHVLETDLHDPVLLAVPMQTLRHVLTRHADHLHDRALVACCKGIELSSGKGPATIIQEILPNATPAILTGPSFAADIARGLPTALTLACAAEPMGQSLQQSLNTPNLRIYRSTDVIGAELGGALKNVIAIGAGAAIGRGMGDSARAALMTRGFAEITRLATHLGAQAETLMGLSGLGDLVLTCTSEQSRNYRFGLALGQGQPFDPDTTVEGVATAHAVAGLAQSAGVDMPICTTLAQLIDGQTSVDDAILSLLNRPLKEE